MGIQVSKRWGFCNVLINAAGVIAIPKQDVGHRSENISEVHKKLVRMDII